ncbi:MAG: hypothetical protein U0640_03620 [Phycisphaerales bacterium]
MTSDQIKAALARAPFRPFRLHMGGGRHADVLHPEFLSINPSGRIVVVYGAGEAMEIIDVLMIQSIEMLPQSSHGHKRRKAG